MFLLHAIEAHYLLTARIPILTHLICLRAIRWNRLRLLASLFQPHKQQRNWQLCWLRCRCLCTNNEHAIGCIHNTRTAYAHCVSQRLTTLCMTNCTNRTKFSPARALETVGHSMLVLPHCHSSLSSWSHFLAASLHTWSHLFTEPVHFVSVIPINKAAIRNSNRRMIGDHALCTISHTWILSKGIARTGESGDADDINDTQHTQKTTSRAIKCVGSV